jgi:hypothetical protein
VYPGNSSKQSEEMSEEGIDNESSEIKQYKSPLLDKANHASGDDRVGSNVGKYATNI